MIHRITGTHLFVSTFGAGLWVDVDTGGEPEAQRDKILAKTRDSIGRLGLMECMNVSSKRIYDQWVFMLETPVDLLYTACNILEWSAALLPDFSAVQQEYGEEENLSWRDIRSWAFKHGVPCVDDEDGLTLGMGKSAQTWPLDALPKILALSAPQYSRIPAVYITGTNGKTTTSRMVSAICQSDQQFQGVGQTSTDGVLVNGDWIEHGDWTGPGAARMILRDPRVDVAILETARGGLMRRGLVIDGVEACAVTNVSDDHLGSWGLQTVYDMAIAKLTVVLGVKEGGEVFLNADCAVLMRAWEDMQSRHPNRSWKSSLFSSTQREGMTLYIDNGWIVHQGLGKVVEVSEIPLTLGGRAQYNTENAMTAIGLAYAIGCTTDAMKQGVSLLVPTSTDSRGRSNWLRYNDADVFVDFAHNPDGIRRVVEMGQRWDAQRKAIVLGQAGDRRDDEIQGIGYQAAELNAEAYFLKELPGHSYHRDPNEVVQLLSDALQEKGVSKDRIFFSESDIAAAEQAMDWVQEGDLLLLLSHEQLDEVMDMVLRRGSTWGVEGT
jgi:cyanophycin synthetase